MSSRDYIITEGGMKCDCGELMQDFTTQDLDNKKDIYTITKKKILKKNNKFFKDNINFHFVTECIRCRMIHDIHVFFENGKLKKIEDNNYII